MPSGEADMVIFYTFTLSQAKRASVLHVPFQSHPQGLSGMCQLTKGSVGGKGGSWNSQLQSYTVSEVQRPQHEYRMLLSVPVCKDGRTEGSPRNWALR